MTDLKLFNLAVNLSHGHQQWVGVWSLCLAVLHVHINWCRGIHQLIEAVPTNTLSTQAYSLKPTESVPGMVIGLQMSGTTIHTAVLVKSTGNTSASQNHAWNCKYIKTWQYIKFCDHNSRKTRLSFIFLHCSKQEEHFTWKTCSPYLYNVLTLPCENETSHFILL